MSRIRQKETIVREQKKAAGRRQKEGGAGTEKHRRANVNGESGWCSSGGGELGSTLCA